MAVNGLKMKILIVEDNEIVVKMLEHVCKL